LGNGSDEGGGLRKDTRVGNEREEETSKIEFAFSRVLGGKTGVERLGRADPPLTAGECDMSQQPGGVKGWCNLKVWKAGNV